MVASGVRRSWETELRSEFRSRSVSIRIWEACASSARAARSIASAVWFANVSSRWSCSGLSNACASDGLHPEHADGSARAE